MSLYYNNGKLLLKSSDSLWYYVDVDLNNGTPYLRIAQDSSLPPSPLPDEFAVIIGGDNNYYDFGLSTVGGAVYIYIIATDPGPASVVSLRGTDGQTYRVQLSPYNGQVYVNLVASTVIGIISLPWRGIVIASEDLTKRRNLTPVTTQMFTTVLTPIAS